MNYEIHYGKADVKVYRTRATPLRGVTAIPESPFVGRENILMAAELEVAVHGTAFLDAYTRGDNRLVVATDTMKNFMHSATLASHAATLEGWLFDIGRGFLATYPHMERLTMRGRELPFPASLVPADGGEGFTTSEVLFARDRNDRSTASLDLEREGDGARITGNASGRVDLQLIKITGSAFADSRATSTPPCRSVAIGPSTSGATSAGAMPTRPMPSAPIPPATSPASRWPTWRPPCSTSS